MLAALAAGLLLVTLYDRALGPYRYPYSGDSASYVDMAASIAEHGRPLVTPWDVEPGDRDAIPQPLFPPGFSLLVAAVAPLTGDVRTAALWPGRVAAALLPCLILLLFRGAAGDAVLLWTGLLALCSPGVRDWQFMGYSDLTALVVAVLSLGALARGLGLAGTAAAPVRGWLWLAGVAAGVGYGLRNAGLAVLAASAATLAYMAWRDRPVGRAALYWAFGAALPLAALAWYNVATFGELQPYDMAASTRPWWLNVRDYAAVQLEDLGVPFAMTSAAPLLAVAGLALVGVLLLYACWRLRDDRRRHGLVMMLGTYAAGGGVMLIASRSRYEWGQLIELRNTLQYSWAIALALGVSAATLLGPRARRAALVVALLSLGSVVVAGAREAYGAAGSGPEPWLVLSRDPAVMGAARALPADTLIASNVAVLFRLGVPRRVRELEVGGSDRDFEGSLVQLTSAAGARPAAFLLVCDEWTAGFQACGARPAAASDAAVDCVPVRIVEPLVALCRPAGARQDRAPPPPPVPATAP